MTPARKTVLALAAFAVFVGAGLARHEPWRDELQPWMLARDSGSVAELMGHMRYEGHPALWHLCLYALTRVTRDPAAMQVFHFVLAMTAAGLLLARWPAPFSLRLAAVFGYFPAWEYAAISRSYALGEALLFAFCVVARGKSPRALYGGAVLLAALANTSVYGTMLAVVFGGWLLFGGEATGAGPRSPRWGAAATVAAGIAVALAQMRPPADAGYAASWHWRFDAAHLVRVITGIWRSYVPLPDVWRIEWWNSNFLLERGPVELLAGAGLGLVIFAVMARALPRAGGAHAVFLVGTLMLLAFGYLKLSGFARHHGHLWLLWIAAVWLAGRTRPLVTAPAAALVVVHVLAAAAAWTLDGRQPFSRSRDVARFLQPLSPDVPVGGSIDWSVSAVSAWLDRPLLQLDSGRRATFVRWDARRGDVYGAPAFGAMWAHAGGRRAVLLLSWPWSEPPGPEPEPVVRVDEALGYRAVRVARFGGAVVHDESYDVYVLSALGSEAASVP